MKSLDNSGIKLSQFKIVSGSGKAEFMSFTSESKNSGNGAGENSQSGQNQGFSGKGESSEQQKDSQRRKQLWEQYKEQNQAFA